MRKRNLQATIEAAILAALALVLDLLPSIQLTPAISVSFAMIPVFIVAFRWGWRAGFLSGFMWGVLQLIFDPYIVHPIQAFIEYVIAFAVIGVSGFFVHKIQKQLSNQHKRSALVTAVIAIFLGSLARYFFHFIAGYYFFAEYAPEDMSAVMYSFAVNGTTMILTFILCAIVMIGLLLAAPRMIVNQSLN